MKYTVEAQVTILDVIEGANKDEALKKFRAKYPYTLKHVSVIEGTKPNKHSEGASCDCCGKKVDERSMETVETLDGKAYFVCQACSGYYTEDELIEKLTG
jgi:methionyl-tRNA synthetase